MGDAKRKRDRKAKFFSDHRVCVYCGGVPETIDHFPPRCFFLGRKWPENYEFSACGRCNSEARLDEQALAVLIRSGSVAKSDTHASEWKQLLQGVRNNQPNIIDEWTSASATQRKRALRQMFGREGDQMRFAGWGAATIGSQTKAVLNRFMIKLAKALFYLHNKNLFEGVLYARYFNILGEKDPTQLMSDLTKIAPDIAQPMRNKLPLGDQFAYRYNYSPQYGVLYAVVRFSPQFIFSLMAISFDMANRLETENPSIASNSWPLLRFECRVANKSAN